MDKPLKSLCGNEWLAYSDYCAERGRGKAARFAARTGAALLKLARVGCDPRCYPQVRVAVWWERPGGPNAYWGDYVPAPRTPPDRFAWLPLTLRVYRPRSVAVPEYRYWKTLSPRESGSDAVYYSLPHHRLVWFTPGQFRKCHAGNTVSPVGTRCFPWECDWWADAERSAIEFFRLLQVRAAGVPG